MIARFLKPLAAIALATSACLAQATTIDFTGSISAGRTFSDIAGFDFKSTSLSVFGFPVGGQGSTRTSLVELGGTTLTITAAHAPAFDLESLQLADFLNIGVRNNVLLSWTFANGSTGSELFKLDGKRGFETVPLPGKLDDLTSLSVSSLLGFQLDNLNVTAVPETGSLALMLAGLGMLGIVGRRRKA
jgi:hypothetical protein